MSKYEYNDYELLDYIQESNEDATEILYDKYKHIIESVTFYTFASLCIERQILTAIKKATRDKHKLLNDSISLDYTYNEDSNLYDNISDDNQPTPEDKIIEMEEEKQLYKIIVDKLSPFEKQVFDLKIKNYSYKEISASLNVDTKKIDNAIQRIKQKATTALSNKLN